MEKVSDYEKIQYLIKQIKIERAYPLSIIEGFQRGEIYVDVVENPTVALFWHYCGFAFIAGLCNEKIMNDIYNMMLNPTKEHNNRLVIQSENSLKIYDTHNITQRDRYIFTYDNTTKYIPVTSGCEIHAITRDNYHLIQGRITPNFSWANKKEFLENGFGYCLMREDRILACAFSAAVSKDYIDIGVEASAEYRGKGYGKVVASAMVQEILRQGKTPMWACDTENEGSMRLACSVGFRVIGTHPWYML